MLVNYVSIADKIPLLEVVGLLTDTQSLDLRIWIQDKKKMAMAVLNVKKSFMQIARLRRTKMKVFKTQAEDHSITTTVNVVATPSSIGAVDYDMFKEFFVKEGFNTEADWEKYLDSFQDADSDWINDIAEFYNLGWDYIDPDNGRCKGNEYFILYLKENEDD